MAVLQATTITGGLTMHGMAAGFMKINAEGAVVMDTNTYLASGSYLALSGGTMTGDITMSGNGRGIYFTGGNNRIYFGGYRALEGSNTGTVLQVGEGYSITQIQSATTQIDGNLYINNNGGRIYFDRLSGDTVGAIGFHSNDVFYVAGHPSYGPTAGNNVKVYGFGADLSFGSSNAGDVITINNSGTINANYTIVATGGSGTTPTLVLNRNIATPSNYYNGLQLEVRATSGTAGIGLHRNGYSHVGIYHDSSNELKFNMNSGTVILPAGAGTLWGSGNLTNLNQLSNGPGYITSSALSNYIYTNSGSFTTAGTGWYRVATTGSDGRGTYFVEVYTTGGNHNPSYLKIIAHGDWGNDKLVSVETDGGFPASAVRITRGASNTFLEVNFTTQILGAGLRVNRTGFDSAIQIYTGALPSGGDTVWDSVSVYSKGYHTPGAVFAKTRMLVGGTDDNSGKADLSVDTGGTATIALAGQYFRVGDSDVNWDLAIRRNGNVETYGQALNLNTQAGNYAVNIRPNNTVVAQYYQDYTYFPGLDFSISRINSAHASNYFRGNSSHLVIGTGGTLYLNYGNTSGTTYIDGTTYINSAVALHANNYNSYAPTLTGGGASGTWGISITGNADTVDGYHASGLWKLNEWNGNIYGHTDGRIYGTIFYDANDSGYYLDPNSQSNLLRIKTNTNWYDNSASDWGGGVNMSGNNPSIGFQPTSSSWWYMLHHSTYMNFYRRNTSGSWNQDGIWDTSGNLYWNNGLIQSNASMRAPIFYDSNDTTYYLDPNSTTSAIFRGSVGLNNTSPINTAWGNASNTTQLSIYGSNYGLINLRGDSGGARTYSMGVGDNQFYMAYDNTAARHNIIVNSSGAVTIAVDVRAPIFYDSSDTTYYVDPNSSSRLRYLYVGDGGSNWSNPGGWDTTFYVSGVNHAIIRVENRQNNYHSAVHSHTGQLPGVGSPGDYDYRITRNWSNRMIFYTNYTYAYGYLEAEASMRAPIFYDSNNTGYYLDPDSRSNIWTLTANGKEHYLGTSGGWDGVGFGNLTNLHFQGHGHFWIGAGNAYWYRGGINTEHDLLITTMYGYDSQSYYRGITFGVENNGNGSSGNYRLGRWQTYGTGWTTARLQVDASLSVGYGARGTRAYDEAKYPLDRGVWAHGRGEAGYGSDRIRDHIFSPTANGGGPWGSFASLEVSSIYDGNSDIPALFRMHQWGSGAAEFWKPQGTVLYLRESPGGGGSWFTQFQVQGSTYVTSSMQAYSYQGHSNVSGTGNASYHPSGVYSTGTNWLYGTMYLNVNSINDAADIRLYNSSYSFRARYTAGSDIYHASLNWYGLQLGNNGGNYIVAGRTNAGGKLYFYVNNTSDFTSVNGTFAAAMHASGRTSFGSDSDNGYQLQVYGSLYSSDWIRVGGSQGLYFESYGGGWRMTDSSYVQSYNGKSLHMNGGSVDYVGSLYLQNGPGVHLQGNTDGSYGSLQITQSKNGWSGIYFTSSGNTLMMNSNESGFYRQGYGWQWRWENGTAYVNKNGQGGGTSATVLDSSNYTSWAAPRAYVHSSYVDFYIYGDQNTYYPVTIHNWNNSHGFQRYSIHRGYGWTAPWDPIGTGSHQGGLTFTFDWAGDIAWGGNDKSIRVIEFDETYTSMVAGMQLAHCEGVVVWLRGGGAGGAHYRLHGPGGLSQTYSINMSSWTSCAGVTYSPRSHDGGTVNSEIRSRYPVRGSGSGDIYVNNQAVIHSGNIGSQSVSYASSAGNADTVDSYHASNFLGYFGNSYYQANTWIQLNGVHGLYAPSYNSAHWMPNTNSTYTTWRIAGSRNGYSGIHDDHSNLQMVMFDGSGNGGTYREANSRWYWYYHLSNDCMGIGTSSTNSSYSIYSNKGHGVYYSGNNAAGFDAIHSGSINGGSTVQGLTLQWQGYGATYVIAYKQGELSPSDMAHVYSVGGFYFKIFDGSSNRFHRWDDNGSVSINSSSQGSYTFNVTGDIYATADVIAFSDARVKEDVRTVENALDKVTKLRGVTYIKKDEENKKRKMGVIAQEVLEVLPEVVHEDNDGYYGVSYGNIVGVLIEAIKEQQKQIDELKQELKNK